MPVMIPESAVVVSCGKCHGNDIPCICITGDSDDWTMFLCFSCFKQWNKNFNLKVLS